MQVRDHGASKLVADSTGCFSADIGQRAGKEHHTRWTNDRVISTTRTRPARTNELRRAVDFYRRLAGLSPITWADGMITSSTHVPAFYFMQLPSSIQDPWSYYGKGTLQAIYGYILDYSNPSATANGRYEIGNIAFAPPRSAFLDGYDSARTFP